MSWMVPMCGECDEEDEACECEIETRVTSEFGIAATSKFDIVAPACACCQASYLMDIYDDDMPNESECIDAVGDPADDDAEIPDIESVVLKFVEKFREVGPAPIETGGVKMEEIDSDDEEDPFQKADAWAEHLALSGRKVGPRGKGDPVLTMAAKGADLHLDAHGTP